MNSERPLDFRELTVRYCATVRLKSLWGAGFRLKTSNDILDYDKVALSAKSYDSVEPADTPAASQTAEKATLAAAVEATN